MHIFITGIAGFLVANLADFYLSKGFKVSGCDNLIGGSLENIDQNKIDFFKGNCEDLDFMVNAMINDYDKIDKIADWIKENNIENHVFLFSASTFTNLAIHRLFGDFPNNTYIDIGTCLTPMMDMPTHRGYLQAFWNYQPNQDIQKICVWN